MVTDFAVKHNKNAIYGNKNCFTVEFISIFVRGIIELQTREDYMKYYIADTHFCDERVMRLAKRPFSSVAEMNDAMTMLWNQKVSPQDEVYIIGDFALDDESAVAMLERLNGTKHLIVGNHDKCLTKQTLNCFKSVSEITTFTDGDLSVTLCHYPLLSYENSIYNGYHIFGHIHNNPQDIASAIIPYLPRHLHCGADVIGFQPKTLEELLQLQLPSKDNNTSRYLLNRE